MNKLVLIGGGGHCKSVLDAALRMDIFSKIVILDPKMDIGDEIMGCKIVGDDNRLKDLIEDGYENAFISVGSIGNVDIRKKLSGLAGNYGFKFPCIFDTSAVISRNSIIEEGVFVGKNAVINAGVKIDKHSIINTGAIIEHDCLIGEYSHISVGACICGNCEIGDNTFVGAKAIITQGIKISEGSFIKAGALVTKSR